MPSAIKCIVSFNPQVNFTRQFSIIAESRALEAEGVVDVSGCRINGNSSNLTLGADEVPVLRGIGVNG